jgi:energy-coupling factor transporter ATP-binding protein EcfA2
MIEVINVTYRYREGGGISGINLVIGDEIVSIEGPNGAGKTTLLKVIAGLLKPQSGEVLVDGSRNFKGDVVYVHQRPVMFRTTVMENIIWALRARKIEDAEERAVEAMELMGIYELRNRHAWKLSAGEMQKVSIARALALRPKYLLLDEPTGSLDFSSVESLASIIRGRKRVVIATHDRDFSEKVADRVVKIRYGRLVR